MGFKKEQNIEREKEMDIIDEIKSKMATIIEKRNCTDLLYIASLSMCRTNQIIYMLAENEYLCDIRCLNDYIEKELCNYEDINHIIKNSGVEAFLMESPELLENMEYDANRVLYIAYDLCESWYNFSNLLNYGCDEDDKYDLVDYITLPLHLLDIYVSDEIFINEKEQNFLEQKVRLDRRIIEEEQRIFNDLEIMIDKNVYHKYFSKYKDENILILDE